METPGELTTTPPGPSSPGATSLAEPTPAERARERAIVLIVAAVQCVNVLDFMIVMPLGPDFAKALGIATSQLGLVGASYTASAAVAGLAGAFFLDRFERRGALMVSMIGLILGTFAGAFAWDLPSLVAARVIAGAFGGPATSLSFSIVADVIPPQRRGRATGVVMSAFAVASILGVPAGLELARRFDWRAPLVGVGLLGILVTAFSRVWLPVLAAHLKTGIAAPPILSLFTNPLKLLAYGTMGAFMLGHFCLIPNIATYLQFNLRYPRDELHYLYLCGGILNLLVMRGVGTLVDRFGSTVIATAGTGLLVGVVYLWMIDYERFHLPVIVLFSGFMLTASFRSVPFNTLTSKIPGPGERAQFMSILSAVQHLAAAAGAVLATRLLVTRPDGGLEGMPRLGRIVNGIACVLPVFLYLIERGVRHKARAMEVVA